MSSSSLIQEEQPSLRWIKQPICQTRTDAAPLISLEIKSGYSRDGLRANIKAIENCRKPVTCQCQSAKCRAAVFAGRFIPCCAAHSLAVIHRSRRSPPMQGSRLHDIQPMQGHIYRQITVSEACPDAVSVSRRLSGISFGVTTKSQMTYGRYFGPAVAVCTWTSRAQKDQ
jgi:hypothetical protein